MVCGSDRFEALFSARDKVFYQDDMEYPAVQCQDCGLVFLSPKPSKRDKYELYNEDYPFAANNPESAQPLFHYQPVIEYLDSRPPGRLLDIGTGNSPLLPTMKKKGWEVAGTEIDGGLVDYFEMEHGIDVFYGELEEAHFESKSFDAASILGVIEHVPDPRLLLEEVARILKDDGLLCLWCFNRGIEAKVLGKYWLGFDAPRHIYSFSYDNMTSLLDDVGFELKGSLFRPISYASYSSVWAYERVRNWFRDKDERVPTYRLGLPKPLELLSRPWGTFMAKRKQSSNMFLFAEKSAIAHDTNDKKKEGSISEQHHVKV
jgi:SAM-dependent methyltransferase